MDTVILIIFFLFGAIIGSFLNVVILRMRSGRTLGGRSMCFTCGTELTFAELVPLGSFLTQRGKCLHCGTKISWQYPLVEAVTGALFALLYAHLSYLVVLNLDQFAGLFVIYATAFSVLIVLTVYDLKHKILPDKLTGLFAVIAFISMFLIHGGLIDPHLPTLWHFLAGAILPLPFAILWLGSKGKWMGLGDAKLMIGIGWLCGLSGGIAAILLAFWIGAVGSLLWILGLKIFGMAKKVTMRTAIPFGLFLALGAVIIVLTQTDFVSILAWFARV